MIWILNFPGANSPEEQRPVPWTCGPASFPIAAVNSPLVQLSPGVCLPSLPLFCCVSGKPNDFFYCYLFILLNTMGKIYGLTKVTNLKERTSKHSNVVVSRIP